MGLLRVRGLSIHGERPAADARSSFTTGIRTGCRKLVSYKWQDQSQQSDARHKSLSQRVAQQVEEREQVRTTREKQQGKATPRNTPLRTRCFMQRSFDAACGLVVIVAIDGAEADSATGASVQRERAADSAEKPRRFLRRCTATARAVHAREQSQSRTWKRVREGVQVCRDVF